MKRNRRKLLVALATGGAVLAGCVDGGSGDDTRNGDGTDAPDDDPGSTDGIPELPEEGYPGTCPEYGTARVICYEAVVGNDGEAVGVENVPAVLEPSTHSLAREESIEFVLSNQSDVALSANFYDWRLDKRVDGEWYRVAPFEINEPLMSIPPGESHTWTMRIDNSGIEDGEVVPKASGTDDLTLGGLGDGQYAFRARGWFEDDDHGDDFAFVGMFDYDGASLELTTTKLIGETEFEGETLVAESAADQRANEGYVLERVEAPERDDERVITEQLLRTPPRREAVALAQEYDADRVRLDGYAAERYVPDPLGAFRYEGQQYDLRKQGED